jgi:hypothetical protein
MVEVDLPKLFARAADILDTNGHYKGDFYNLAQVVRGRPPNACSVCAYGALNIAGGSPYPDDINGMSGLAAMVLADYLAIPATPQAIGAWNDDDAMTPERVQATFREIAAKMPR